MIVYIDSTFGWCGFLGIGGGKRILNGEVYMYTHIYLYICGEHSLRWAVHGH